MVKKRTGLRSLWDSPERRAAAHGIIVSMIEGDIEETEAIHPRADGRWKLSGFDFGMRSHEQPFQYFTLLGTDVPPGVARGAENLYRNLLLDRVDFSKSVFYDSDWLDCTFRHCLFDRADLYGSRFRGCTFQDVRFNDCWIENNALGESSENNLGLFSDVEFVKGVFSRVSFGFPRFERCRFLCSIKRTNFHGSQFEDCVFKGVLDVVEFNRSPSPMRLAEDFILAKNPPLNEMKGIDFSLASFLRVAFDDCLDLRDCRLPKKQGAFLVMNSSRTLERVLTAIENEWKGTDMNQAISVAKFLLQRKHECSVDQVVVLQTELEKRYGFEFAQKLVFMIQNAMDKI